MAQASKVLDKLGQQYFDAIINPVNSIYVDIEMLQDLRLGALLSTVTVEEEVKYIYSRLPSYNKRLNLKTAEYFPVLHKTDEELDDIILKNPFKVAFMSPWTIIYNNLMQVLSFLAVGSKALAEKSSRLQVVINCSDIEYPIELFDKFVNNIKPAFKGIEFKLSHQKRYTANHEFYDSFDMFFLYDHETFLNNTNILDSFTTKDRYSTKIIYTLPLINDNLKLDKSMHVKALASTAANLNLFCDFFYMNGGILIPEQ